MEFFLSARVLAHNIFFVFMRLFDFTFSFMSNGFNDQALIPLDRYSLLDSSISD